jgi:hypothetical protein
MRDERGMKLVVEVRSETKFWLESLKRSEYSQDLGVDWVIINIKMDLSEIGLEGVDCIHLARIGTGGGL